MPLLIWEIYTEKDLERLRGMIEREAAKKETDPITIAAALLYMNVGEEPEELQEERSFFDRVRRRGSDGRRNSGGRRDSDGRRNGGGRRDSDGRRNDEGRRDSRGHGRNSSGRRTERSRREKRR